MVQTTNNGVRHDYETVEGGVKPEVQQKLLNADLLGGQLTELGATEQIDEDLHRGLVIEHPSWSVVQ